MSSWIFLILCGSAVLAMLSVIDKKAHGYGRSYLSYLLLIGISATLAGCVILIIVGIPNEISSDLLTTTISLSSYTISIGIPSSLLFAILSGAFMTYAAFLVQKILFSEDVSTTVPITQSAPIFAAILAILILGEELSFLQWISIVITVLGCALLSVNNDLLREFSLGKVIREKNFYVLMFASFLFGASFVVGKMALDNLPVIFVHGVRSLVAGLIFLSHTIYKSSPRSDFVTYIRTRKSLLLLVSFNEILANIGFLLTLWALYLGPASLVTALSSTRALFIVLYSVAVSYIWKGALGETNTSQAVVLKVSSVLVIVIGVAGISLF